MAEEYIGIDFGTTNTAVVRLRKDELGQKVDLLGDEGKYPFSSIVAIPKDGSSELLFGRAVREKRLTLAETHDIHLSMKSFLDTKKEFVIGGVRYSATDITTKFLQYVKKDILDHHKVDISQATFSFPVDFSPEARRELKKAAKSAGIQPMGFVNESTAAYLANKKEGQAYSTVMVIDWGGGTLDISIMNVSQNKLEEHSIWGERIGGDDIDIALAKGIHASIMHKEEQKISFEQIPSSAVDDLRNRCEKAKIEFSNYKDDFLLTLNNYGPYGRKNLNLPYKFFENIATPIIKSTVFSTIETALQNAKLTKHNIDAVIIVGGSSNIAPFQTAMCETFGVEKIIVPDHKQWSVATGAAFAGSLKGAFHLNTTLSVLLSDDSPFALFEKERHSVGSRIPSMTFDLTEECQEAHFIFVDENKNVFARHTVPTKGYQKEKITLEGRITEEQIAYLTIKSKAMGKSKEYERHVEINKLKFYYDISSQT